MCRRALWCFHDYRPAEFTQHSTSSEAITTGRLITTECTYGNDTHQAVIAWSHANLIKSRGCWCCNGIRESKRPQQQQQRTFIIFTSLSMSWQPSPSAVPRSMIDALLWKGPFCPGDIEVGISENCRWYVVNISLVCSWLFFYDI